MSRVVVVADDSDLRQSLISMLSPQHWMMLPEGVESRAALGEIHRVKPRLVVIQAELRNRNGLDLAAEILRVHDAAIVVVANSGALAVRAFELGVADFIVGPVRPERMAKAIQRALGRQARGESIELNQSVTRSTLQSAKLRVKSKGGFIFLKYEELVWVEAAGNYLNLHCVDRMYRVREPLSEFVARLDNRGFVRIHRSIVANTAYIRELRSWGMGDYVVVLQNSKELPVSRSYREVIDQWMSNGEFPSPGTEGTGGPPLSNEDPLSALPA